jgi:hypothetical protein
MASAPGDGAPGGGAATPLDADALAACVDAFNAPYDAATARVQAALTEIRRVLCARGPGCRRGGPAGRSLTPLVFARMRRASQAAAAGALQASRDALAPTPAVEELLHAVRARACNARVAPCPLLRDAPHSPENAPRAFPPARRCRPLSLTPTRPNASTHARRWASSPSI